MSNWKRHMALISRDMLSLHGHFVSLQGWDGVAPQARPAKPRPATADVTRAASAAPRIAKPCAEGCA
jgi:hypothetical protein